MQNTQQFHLSWSFSCSPRESPLPQRSGSLDCSRRWNIKPTWPHFHPSGRGCFPPISKGLAVVLTSFCLPLRWWCQVLFAPSSWIIISNNHSPNIRRSWNKVHRVDGRAVGWLFCFSWAGKGFTSLGSFLARRSVNCATLGSLWGLQANLGWQDCHWDYTIINWGFPAVSAKLQLPERSLSKSHVAIGHLKATSVSAQIGPRPHAQVGG